MQLARANYCLDHDASRGPDKFFQNVLFRLDVGLVKEFHGEGLQKKFS